MKYKFYHLNDLTLAKPTSSEGRQKGWHQKPDSADGLWFIAAPIIQTFKMPVEVDLIWFDGQYKVKKVIANAKPNRLYFALNWNCLELPAGSIAKQKIAIGSSLKLLTA